MKIIKNILIVIVTLIAIILMIALFTKNEYTVQREITINKPKSEVYNYIKYLENQDNFSVWAKKDPNLIKEYTGTDGTVGFVSAWESNMKDVGKGAQTITKIIEGERIEMGLHFIKPFDGIADAAMTTKEATQPDHTIVQWSFHSKMKYPMNIMLLCMNMDKMLGNDLATGLSNLKVILEK
jgi:hypothetical protein